MVVRAVLVDAGGTEIFSTVVVAGLGFVFFGSVVLVTRSFFVHLVIFVSGNFFFQLISDSFLPLGFASFFCFKSRCKLVSLSIFLFISSNHSTHIALFQYFTVDNCRSLETHYNSAFGPHGNTSPGK